eukprot:212725_1
MNTLSLFSTPRKISHKRKFNECTEYLESKRVISGYLKQICSNHSASIPQRAVTNILDLLPRNVQFDIFSKQIHHQEPITSNEILNAIRHSSTIGSSTGFNKGIHEWIIPLPSTCAMDDYHYYFGVVTNVDDFVHSEYSEWNGIGYIWSTFGVESFASSNTIRIRLDCVAWTLQIWINDDTDDSISFIMNGEYVENEDKSTIHSLVAHETYYPVVSIYKKGRFYGIR